MPKQARSTLRAFFGKGQIPTDKAFADLIDSNLNMVDEGFTKTPKNVFELSTLDGRQSLMSFMKDDKAEPLWTFGYIGESDGFAINYQVSDKEKRSVLTVLPEEKVGVNTITPASTLDVNGFLTTTGRMGRIPKEDEDGALILGAYADGGWHDITEELTGCHAFEVVAGVVASENNKNYGQYALAHAIAMNTYNPTGFFGNFLGLKNRIHCRHAYYRSMAYRLKFRWETVGSADDRRYKLQVRSNVRFKSSSSKKRLVIQYHITELWSQPLNGMQDADVEDK